MPHLVKSRFTLFRTSWWGEGREAAEGEEDHQERWEKCGIPDEITFKTKPELVLEMLKAVVAEGTLRFRWVACDEAYGKDPDFLDSVAGAIPADEWDTYLIKEGGKGPLVAEFAFRRMVAVRDGLPGPEVWLVSAGPCVFGLYFR